MRGKIRILLVDDHKIMRQCLAALLGQDNRLNIIGEASNGQMAVELAGKLMPDVVVMDMQMAEMNGMEATRRIVSDCPDVRVIGLSTCSGHIMSTAMQSAGAVACIDKGDAIDVLITAIHACSDQPVLSLRS